VGLMVRASEIEPSILAAFRVCGYAGAHTHTKPPVGGAGCFKMLPQERLCQPSPEL
jgi:hypothetical protein